MPDFLSEPFVLFALIFVVARIVKAMKGKPAQPGATAPGSSTEAEVRKRALKRTESGSTASFEQRLQELARQFEQQTSGAPAPPVIRTAPSEPLAAIGMQPTVPEGASLEAAALEVGSIERLDIAERVVEPTTNTEQVDYDLNADAFAYHSLGEASARKTLPIGAFAGFQSVSGARVSTASVESIEEPADMMDDLFGSHEELCRAFVLSEVLGRPRSQRALGRS